MELALDLHHGIVFKPKNYENNLYHYHGRIVDDGVSSGNYAGG
jgi:hypothetical protein